MTPKIALPSLVFLAAISSFALSAYAAHPVSSYEPANVHDGAEVAQRECSMCHAIGKIGVSPRSDAPVFRKILSRYHSETLESELIEGIKLGHPDMPRFQLNPKAVDDLIVYLKSIQTK